MKARKHGKGLTHNQVIRFSNVMAAAGYYNCPPTFIESEDAYNAGWEAACKYFAHQLRTELRYYEKINEI